MTVLDIFALLVLAILLGTVIYILFFLGGWPGRIAQERNHPQADSVNICGWLGILTGVLWFIAMVWAFWRYPGSEAEDSQPDEVSEKILGLESRLKSLEARLAAQGGDES